MSGNGPTLCERVKSEVDRARPFIDAGPAKPNGWRPSELIMIGFCAIQTGPGGDERAAAYVDDMLSEARNRYAAGFWANPFMEPAQARQAENG